MHNHSIAIALADARVADLQQAAAHRAAIAPPRRHLRALAPLALAATAALAALAPTSTLAGPWHDTATPARSADTRDVARTAQLRQDLRSADARDAADGRGTYNSPDVVIVKVPKPSPAAAESSSSASGIDWEDAGIGAGGLLGLSLIGFGGALVVVHRRRATEGAPPVAGL